MEEREPSQPEQDDEEKKHDAIIKADDTGMLAQQELINEVEERPQ